jgi:WD40 repeat protein/DNA-binding SARP family transcriptional activator
LTVRPGDPVSADRLADLLWGDGLPASWPKLVQGCVVRLRKQLGQHAIETSSLGYRLVVQRDEIDAQRFTLEVDRARELLAAGEAERARSVLTHALALWRGSALVELDGWDPGRIEAARLEELRHTAEELYVEASLRAGLHDHVLAKAAALVSEEPLRERRWALLATAQYQNGRQGEALATLRRLRSVLDRDLGLDAGQDIKALEEAILRQDPSLVAARALPEPSATCPYQGLTRYDVEDADRFFGRDAEVRDCLRRLADAPVLAVVGPSGSGKSSLVRAGVAAALGRDGHPAVVVTPGRHPLEALTALPSRGTPPTLVVDQCEEVFSLCDSAVEREQFLTALVGHAQVAPLVVSLRADHLGDVASHPGFARLLEQGLHLIAAMDETALREAIDGPAQAASLVLEPGLADLLIGEVVGQSGALPLLSHALAETWQRREGRTLTVAGYQASGGIKGAVAQTAEAVYGQLTPEEQALLREVLLRLVMPGPDGVAVRTRLPRRQVVPDPGYDALVDLLVGSRLVTSDGERVELAHESLARAWPRLRDWLAEDVEGQQTLHHLATAADSWHGLGRPDSELYRGVRLAKVLEWRERETPSLTENERAFVDESKRLSEVELRSAERRAREQSRTNRRLRGLLVTAVLLLVGALVAGFVAVRQADRAAREALAADAGRAGAQALVVNDIDTSLLLAAAGVRLDPTPESRANLFAAIDKRRQLVHSVPVADGVVTGLDASPRGSSVALYGADHAVRLYDARTGALRAVRAPDTPVGLVSNLVRGPFAFSPDGSTLAVGTPPFDPEPVRLLDAETLRPTPVHLPGLPTLPAHTGVVGYSRDGRFLFAAIYIYKDGPDAAFSGGRLLVWDVSSPDGPVLRFDEHRAGDEINQLAGALSPDGSRLYTSNPLTAYDVGSGRVLYRRPAMTFHDLSLSPDGSKLALTSTLDWETDEDTDDVRIVDARTGETRRVLEGHTDAVTAARFSPDGDTLVSVGNDFHANLWDVETGQVVDTMQLDDFGTATVGFSRDGALLYSAAGDGTMRSWDLTGRGRYIEQLAAPAAFIWGCTYAAPGGRTVWQLGDAGIRFIDVATGRKTDFVGLDLEGSDTCGAWHPSGERLAMPVGRAVTVWDARDGHLIDRNRVSGANLMDLDYSTDGSRIVVTDDNGRVAMVDADSLEVTGRKVRPDRPVRWLSASPDNRHAFLVTGGEFLADGAFVTPSDYWSIVDLEKGTVVSEGRLPMADTIQPWYSPDGRHVAVGSAAGEVLLFDTETGEVVQPPIDVHKGFVQYVAWSTDSARFASSGLDGSVALFDGTTGAHLGSVTTPSQAMVGSEFLPDGHRLLIASNDQGIYLWDTRVDAALSAACRMAGRDLTAAEWRESFGDRPYEPTC